MSHTQVGLLLVRNESDEVVRAEYHADGTLVAYVDWRPGERSHGDPLIEAARRGDELSVTAAIAAGLGRSPGFAQHAAYVGVPGLVATVTAAAHAATLPPDPRPEPGERPPAVETGGRHPVWIAAYAYSGAWVVGDSDPATGFPAGTWVLWEHLTHRAESCTVTEFGAGGTPRLRRTYYGYRADNPGGWQHRNGLPLYREWSYDPMVEREFDGGVLTKETTTLPDGAVAVRRYDGGRVDLERVSRAGRTVREEWYDETGARLALALPDGVLTVDGEHEPVDRWTAFDGAGARIAEGPVRAGERGRPVGQWQAFGPDGSVTDRFTFAPLSPARSVNISRLAGVLSAWHAVTPLDGIDDVDWADLDTNFDNAADFPFLLKGLRVPHRLAVETAVRTMWDRALHQGTIEDVTGPAMRYLIRSIADVDDAALLAWPVEFLVKVATRNCDLGAAHAIKRVYRSLPADADPVEHFHDNDIEGAYFDVYRSIEQAGPLWTRLASVDAPVRRMAQILLAVAPGEAAAAALQDRLAAEPDRLLRADMLLGLLLHEPDDRMRATLLAAMDDEDTLLRFCAALTWLRHRQDNTARAVEILIAALSADSTGAEHLDGFGQLFLGSGQATADAAALAGLPTAEATAHVARLAAAIDEVNAVNAVHLVRALLDVVFPTAAYQDGEKLNPAQADAVRAIATSSSAWTFNANLIEVLRYNGLPCDRDTLLALADSTA